MAHLSASYHLIKGNYFIHRLMIGVLALGLLGAGVGYYQKRSHYRFTTVTEGEVYQSGAMPKEALRDKVIQYGIRAVIDLRRPRNNVDEEHAVLTQLGVKHFNLPSQQIPKDEVVKKFLEIMDHPEYRPVLIHCEHGIGRAVLFTAIYRMEYEGWSNEQARRAAYLQSTFGSSFKPNEEKAKFIHEYVPRWRLQKKSSSSTDSP